MPARNGTGPMGNGPMTGYGAGPCAGFFTKDYADSQKWPAMRCGRGCGYHRTFYATGLPRWARCDHNIPVQTNDGFDSKAFLNHQAALLEGRLAQIKNQLAALNQDD